MKYAATMLIFIMAIVCATLFATDYVFPFLKHLKVDDREEIVSPIAYVQADKTTVAEISAIDADKQVYHDFPPELKEVETNNPATYAAMIVSNDEIIENVDSKNQIIFSNDDIEEESSLKNSIDNNDVEYKVERRNRFFQYFSTTNNQIAINDMPFMWGGKSEEVLKSWIKKEIQNAEEEAKKDESKREEPKKIPEIEPLIPPVRSPLSPPAPPPQAHEPLVDWTKILLFNKGHDLRHLLMLLSNNKAPPHEIPYRRALMDTLVSEKYQRYINASWIEDDEDVELKKIRSRFAFDYLKAIDWEKTKYLSLCPPGIRDLHAANLEAMHEAFLLPLAMGIFREEDLSVDNMPPE